MTYSSSRAKKLEWSGYVVAVQPRIRLTRSFDERFHSYLGYVLLVEGSCDGQSGRFLIAVGSAARERYGIQAGMELSGCSAGVEDSRKETAALYKTSGLKVVKDNRIEAFKGPPFLGVPPGLETYRNRGHRRLSAQTYDAKCTTCVWGCRMSVEMIIDQWDTTRRKYRFETFCYGPKSCLFYSAGPLRKVPGRMGMSFTEEAWVDEEATSHRTLDD